MTRIIEVKNISKTFSIKKNQKKWFSFFSSYSEDKFAVDHISFSLNEGDFVGFLGPNGAGKSTTLKMLTGILTPTTGTMLVKGIVPYKERLRHAFNIGVVFGQRSQLWWDLPPEDTFKLLAKIYRIPSKRYSHNLSKFIKILGLDEFLHIPVRKLSLGQKMRCELAAALLHDPAILFLDEPTIGLDLFAKEAVRFFLKEINRDQGTTILLTTHDLGDVENLCEKVIIIDKGRIVRQDTLSRLKLQIGDEKIISFEIDPRDPLRLPPGCRKLKSEGNHHYIAYKEQKAPDVIKMFLDSHKVYDINFISSDISDIIKNLLRESPI